MAIATRNRRRSDDPFFLNGDDIALQSSQYNITHFHLSEEKIEEEESQEDGEAGQILQELRLKYPYPCSAPSCSEMFATIQECQEHYDQMHVFVCQYCCNDNSNRKGDDGLEQGVQGRVFPNNFLLDLHLQEVHDTYFQTALEHNKAKYACLVPSCPITFPNDSMRLKHLQQCHSFPKWFRFHPRRHCYPCHDAATKEGDRGTASSKSRNSSSTKKVNKTKQWWKQKRLNYNNQSTSTSDNNTIISNDNDGNDDSMQLEEEEQHDDPLTTTTTTVKPTDSTTHLNNKQNDQKKQRNERRKKKNSLIPCRFYHRKGGCWRGDKCMFLHSDAVNKENENTGATCSFISKGEDGITNKTNHDPTGEKNKTNYNNDDDDVVMKDLVDEIQTKARITIPNKISFGRRRR